MMLEASSRSGLMRAVAALGVAVLLSVVVGTGCSRVDPGSVEVSPETILADGSSTVYPITREAAKRFMRTQKDAPVSVKFSGTTGGFRKFVQGETDISNASRPMNAEERRIAEANGIRFLELPLANDALAIVVHPSNRWLAHLTMEDLKKIWSPESEGRVMKWSDVRPEWPDRPINLYGRGKDSGTFDYFTEKVTGETRSIRSDYFGSEDEELLAEKIASDPDALGFFGIGAYHRHWDTLRVVSVDSGGGPVYPSLETVKDGSYVPFTRPLFLYVNESSFASKPDLLPFLRHYYAGLSDWLPFTGYLPASPDEYETADRQLQSSPAGQAGGTSVP